LREIQAIPKLKALFCVIIGADGSKYLQVDTYGSSGRRFQGKKSQSIRFTPEAIEQLTKIIEQHF
jgi:hypothetical protein